MDTLIDKYIMGLYQDLEDEIIADIARRVKKTGRYTETAELMAKSMVEHGYSAEKIQTEVMKMLRADKAYQMAVAENTAAYKQEVQDIINQTVKDAKKAGNELVAEAGNMAWNNDLSMWQEHGVDLKKPNSMSQLLLAFQKQTAGELKNLTKTMGFKNTVLGTTGVLNAYQREMDLALLKVATGTFSYDQAVNDCVHRLAQSGLRSIDYASGRSYQLDTAARMSVRTGLSQLSGKIMEANLASTGQDLVITSQHMGSRPEHAEWQNKVFSYSGKNKKYPDFKKSTGYGTVAGLKGVNCTHDFYPFWEGASVIPDDIKEPAPVKINGKEYDYYQVSQQQRKMERDIRATKREIEAQKAIGGDTTELQSKLRKQTNDYKQFSAAAGVKVKNNRLRVEKAITQSNKSKSKKAKNGDIINKKAKNTSNITKESKSVVEKVYKQLSEEEFKAIKQPITEAERKIIYGKTHLSGYVNSSNARKMNALLRAEEELPADYREIELALKGVIGRYKLPDDLLVTRYVADDALEGMFGIAFPQYKLGQAVDDYWKQIENLPSLIERGKVYIEKGFLSTSGVANKNVMTEKGIKMIIKVPKGTPAYVTTNYKESEIIFDEKMELHIVNSYIENHRQSNRKLVLECEIR